MSHDETILRPLAAQYAQAAAHPRNQENANFYRAVNDLHMIRPVVLIDELPWHEMGITLQCEDEFLRGVESHMRRTLFQWEHFPADMIISPFIGVPKVIHNTGFGIDIQETILRQADGNHIVSHAYVDQLTTDADLERLRDPVITYDHEETMRRYNLLGNILGDLPVKVVGTGFHVSPWDYVSQIMSVSNMMISFIDRPQFMHKLVARLMKGYIAMRDQLEAQHLLSHSNTIHCTPALTDQFPAVYETGVRCGDIWGRGTAQALGNVSKAMHDEFDIEYMIEVMKPMGLVYYGCCEPLSDKIDIVEKLPNLRKIGMTPWADVDIGAERIGKKYVLSSKPNPASVAMQLDEEGLRRELGKTLAACKRNGCAVDITLKDISTCGHRIENMKNWEKIAMEMVQAY